MLDGRDVPITAWSLWSSEPVESEESGQSRFAVNEGDSEQDRGSRMTSSVCGGLV